MDFKGKVAVVLGASAPTSVGSAVAEQLAARGAKVVVGARRLELLEDLAKKIGGTACACDMSKEADVAALVETASKTYGRLDIAVNTANTRAMGKVDDATDERLRLAFETNFCGYVYFVRHAARAMTEGGSIVVFSTLSVTRPLATHFPYAASKAAIELLVRQAALEYGPRNIRVNGIRAGAIRTETTQLVMATPGMEKSLAREVPLGRVGEREDFADATLWLAGNAFVTGEIIDVSGGNQLTRFPRPDEMGVFPHK